MTKKTKVGLIAVAIIVLLVIIFGTLSPVYQSFAN